MAQAAVAGLGDELFLEPLGAGMGEFQQGVTSGFEWLDPDTAGFIYIYIHRWRSPLPNSAVIWIRDYDKSIYGSG